MKEKIISIVKPPFLALLLVLASLSTGCQAGSGIGSWFVTPTKVVDRAQQTNMVTMTVTNTISQTNIVTQTNYVQVAASTNAVTGVITPAYVQPVIVNQPTVSTQISYSTNVVPVVLPEVAHTNYSAGSAIGAGETVAQMVPIPGVGPGATILAALFGVVMGVINNRNKRKADAIIAGHVETISTMSDVLQTSKDAVKTLVGNVETIRTAALQIPGYASVDAKIMPAITQVQNMMGVHDVIHAEVKQLDPTNATAVAQSALPPTPSPATA